MKKQCVWLGTMVLMAAGVVAWSQAGQQGPSPVNSDYVNATGIAVDGHGNLYVADAGAAQVDEVEAGTGGAAAGTVSGSSTVVTVGSGFTKPTGVAVDGMGDVFVADAGAGKVFEIEAGTGGAATGTVNSGSTVMAVGAGFSQPSAVAVDASGNVYVGDPGSKKLYEIEAGTGGAATGIVNSGSTVETLTPTNVDPVGVAVDATGDVFFASPVPGGVYEILAGTGTAAAGTVNASSSEVALGQWTTEPMALTANTSGEVFVVASDAVWEVAANSSSGATPVGNLTLTVNQGTSTVDTKQGDTVTVPFSVNSTNAFTGLVTMSCAPGAGYTCSISPTSLSLTADATVSGTLTVTPTTTAAAQEPVSSRGAGALALASLLWMPGLLLGGLAFRRKLAATTRWMIVGGLMVLGMSALTGCYTNPVYTTKTTSFQETVLVTATSGSVQQSVPLYLQVQLSTPIIGTSAKGSTGGGN